VTAVDELVLSQEDQPQPTDTSINTRDIQRDVSNIVQCRTDHSPQYRSELYEVSEKSPCAETDCIVSFSCINASRGSVATQLRCGGIFIITLYIANLPQSVAVKGF